MADLTPSEVDAIKKFMDMLKTSTGQLSDEFKQLIKQVDKFGGSTITDLTKGMDEFEKEISKGRRTYKDSISDLKRLKNAFDDLDDSARSTKEGQDLRTRIEKAATTSRNAVLLDGAKEASKVLIKGIYDYYKQQVMTGIRGVMAGGSPFQVAADLQAAAIDSVTGTVSQLGGVASKVGGALMMIPTPATMVAGALLSVVGAFIESGAKEAAEIMKFKLDVVNKQLEKTYKSFQQATSAGALFTKGIGGFYDAATSAGLTVDQFSKALAENSIKFSAAGLSVSGGAELMSKAMQMGGNRFKTQMINLGYGIEEVPGLMADVMRDMRQSGKAILNPKDIQAETAKYAENLRVISAITGEDAKKKMEQVREQANQLAFQQKLAGMDEKQRKGVLNAMANMSDLERKNFMDMVNFGAVINKEGAVAASMSEGLSNSVNEAFQSFNAGKLDEIEQRKISAKYGDQIKSELLGNTGIALAGAAGVGGVAQAVSEAMGKELQFRNNFTAEAIKAAEEAAKQQKDTNDALSKGITNSIQRFQDMMVEMQELLKKPIADFANTVPQILTGFRNKLKEMGLITDEDVVRSDQRMMSPHLTNRTFEEGKMSPGQLQGPGRYAWAYDNYYLVGSPQYEEAKKKEAEKKGTPPDTARAFGGPLAKGQLSLVGERGPELFRPSVSGDIINNEQLKNMGRLADNVETLINSMSLTTSSTAARGSESDLVSVLDNYGKVSAEQLKTTKELLAYTRENVDILNRLYNVST